MSDVNTATATATNPARMIVIAALVLGAFLGAYKYAAAREAAAGGANGSTGTYQAFNGKGGTGGAGATGSGATGGGAGGAACACCGSSAPTEGGLTGDLDEGAAKTEGGVQKIDVDLSNGYYSPNQIVLKAGVPTEITFGQSSGCTAQVMSNELGFFEDLSAGPRTVKLPALEKGEYPFYCGMQMVFGKIVVK